MSEEQEEIKHQLGLDKKQNYFLSKKVKVFAFIIISVLLTTFLFWPKQVSFVYTTENVRVDDLVIVVSTTGNVEPTEKVDVGSEVSGTLSDVYVDFDDKVQKGMILARIDTTKLKASYTRAQATLLQARASLLEVQATLTESKKAYERGKDLYQRSKGEKPLVRDMDILVGSYERAKARKMSVLAQVSHAKATLETDKYNLERAVILSPIDGIILDTKVEAGQTVVASMQTPLLFVIAKDLKKMKLLVSIDEADVGEVSAGQKATFTVDAYPNKKFNAHITKVRLNANIVNSVVTYDAELAVDNKELLLRPGMTASTEIIVKTIYKALLVPNSALRFKPEDSNNSSTAAQEVWVLKDDVAQKVKVQVGRSNGILTSIESSELTSDSKVIVKSKKVKH